MVRPVLLGHGPVHRGQARVSSQWGQPSVEIRIGRSLSAKIGYRLSAVYCGAPLSQCGSGYGGVVRSVHKRGSVPIKLLLD